MCGIAGACGPGAERLRVSLQRACEFIRHRGPDDDGFFFAPGVALGMRRLSIIDVAGGKQPVTNEDESLQLIYNGELYNHRELRAQLERAGHHFRTQSDSEVIVHWMDERGTDGLRALNGIFAFALWDANRRQLLLARDRVGAKPLYYAQVGERLYFASEIKALLAFEVPRVINPQALAEHFTFQNTFGETTFLRDVQLLAPGHSLSCQVEDDRLRVTRGAYHSWDVTVSAPRNRVEAARELRERFEAAVTRQLMSEVPLGTYLSGGMDTGSISAIASRHVRPLHTFTCGFEVGGVSEEEQLFDESAASRDLAHHLGTQHHELTLRPGMMEPVLPRVVWHLDEPRVGISYQVLHTTELIRKHVTVVLSGVGGDELWAGYPWRYRRILDCTNHADFEREYYRAWIRFMDDDEKRGFFSDRINRDLADYSTFDSFRAALAPCPQADPLNKALWFDMVTFMHGLLVVEDKLSMANSVEARVPFLDNELIDFALTCPAEWKLQGEEFKILLKQAMRGLLPEATLHRRKQGFTPPDATWYRGETRQTIERLILSERALGRDVFRPEAVRRVFDEHMSGARNHRFMLWSLMCFEWWCRLFLDGESLPA